MPSPKKIAEVLRQIREEGRLTRTFFTLYDELLLCTTCGSIVHSGAKEHHNLWHAYWEGMDPSRSFPSPTTYGNGK